MVTKRNLTRSLLQGHPWVYREALGPVPHLAESGLAHLYDQKGRLLASGYFDRQSPLAFRTLCTEKKVGTNDIALKLKKALDLRLSLVTSDNNSFRLINGEGDGLAGLVCDVYGDTAVLQTDGEGLAQFWNLKEIAQWVQDHLDIKNVFYKKRSGPGSHLVGKASESVLIKENSMKFDVDVLEGQKTGFFLDQRDNRQLIKKISDNKNVLNLFSYTGGFSVAAGVGGAIKVTSVDISSPAIEAANKNWRFNNLPGEHRGVAANVFDFLQETREKYDLIVVDPPSFAPSEDLVEKATASYVEIFSKAIKTLVPGGQIALSSCSSHISQELFMEICQKSVSKARAQGQVVYVGGQPLDHPFPLACPELRYLKFVLLRVTK